MTGSESCALMKSALTILVCVAATSCAASVQAQSASFTVTVVPPVHGTVRLVAGPTGGWRVPSRHGRHGENDSRRAGTCWTPRGLRPGTVRPDVSRVNEPRFEVTIDHDKQIGASFIEAAAVKHINVTHDIVYAKPGVKPLKYDVLLAQRARRTCRRSSSSTAAAGWRTTRTSCAASRAN